jgi:DNA-binding NarL/FixJ family response regulator
MKLHILAVKENVKQRWLEISTDYQVDTLVFENLDDIDFTSDSFVLVHLESFDQEQLAVISAYWNKVNLIAFSDNPLDAKGIEILLRGFKGYLNTFVSSSVFEQLLISIKKGDIWAGESIVQKMLKRLLLQNSARSSASHYQEQAGNYGLSDREKDTVNVLITGASNKEIGRELDITERTVKAHVSSILKKTNTTDRVSLIIKLKDSY